MDKPEIYRIRPAGRHLLTIGEDLIHDHHAAIIELVKNAYDADSRVVTVSLELSDDEDSVVIIIKDDGHGMSRDTVINHWLVPSTRNKLQNRVSPSGRIMQGRKGIGRYAASILGSDLLLETISETGEKTEVYFKWSDFESAEYLSDVEIQVNSSFTDEPPGTKLTITGEGKYKTAWYDDAIRKLEYDLRKLVSPVEEVRASVSGVKNFQIFLKVDGFFYGSNQTVEKEITPFPLFDLYDYRISGKIDQNGKGNLTYSNHKARNSVDENIPVDLDCLTDCGNLFFDIRVYDRENESIDEIIRRGLKNEKGYPLARNEAKKLLDENNGIGVYRNEFRIRPLGDPDFDWLTLNEQRIQMPSQKIGSNQVIGYVQIESEELSDLQEKSARDGLKDNNAFRRLKKITGEVISKLEERRYIYRRKAGLSRPVVKVEHELEKLFNFEDVKVDIAKKLAKQNIDKKLAYEIVRIIATKEEDSNRIVEDIRKAVAVYQGHATLGKIINVILHEGRKPLNYFKNQIPNLLFWAEEFRVDKVDQYLDEILPIAGGLATNAQLLVNLFGRLDPLAAAKRKPKEVFNIQDVVKHSFDVFESQMIDEKITKDIKSINKKINIWGWSNDILIIMTNLIENSIYWITEKKVTKRNIEIKFAAKDNQLEFMDYRDTGPGIERHLIESGVIFEPEFTTKPQGTGLGLAIAGEAASRNGLEIKVFESDTGAYFRLQPTAGGQQWNQ